MKRPEPITPRTPTTTSDHVATILFWSTVFGWPLFVLIWRWLH